MNTDERLAHLGVHFPDILVPSKRVDPSKWAVIACDQHTANRDYWLETERIVGDAPSTLRLILPEVYLADGALEEKIAAVQATAEEYLDGDVFERVERSAVWVRRELADGSIRKGVVLAVDLERYDYRPEAKAPIRASEETIPERLPVRAQIRDGAALETPHVLVLLDDPAMSVIEPIESALTGEDPLYDVPLMQDGGRVTGYRIPVTSEIAASFAEALEGAAGGSEFVFATGDGNHSLAAAKSVWEARKAGGAPETDPFRYCLVEIVNVYDPGLPFYAIHRLVESDDPDEALHLLIRNVDGRFQGYPRETLARLLESNPLAPNEVALITRGQAGIIGLQNTRDLTVHVVESVLARGENLSVDYVHGTDEALRIAEERGACAVVLPDLDRTALFATIGEAGELPRKAFSLGEAQDKRYYFECRSLR